MAELTAQPAMRIDIRKKFKYLLNFLKILIKIFFKTFKIFLKTFKNSIKFSKFVKTLINVYSKHCHYPIYNNE